METILQDVRYGVRQLLRQPGFSVVAVLTLALGIGASTAIFTVIDAALLRPLPYPNPEQLVTIYAEIAQPGRPPSRPTPSMDDMRQWQAATDVFSSVAGWGRVMFGRIVDSAQPERVEVLEITEDYLPLHGVAPLLGRGFGLDDMRAGAPAVVLLGHGYWQRRYGGDRNVIGEIICYDDGVATIIGILPPSFDSKTAIWRPLRIDSAMASRRGTGRISVYGRLRPGLGPDDAARRLSARMRAMPGPDGTAAPVNAVVSSRLEMTTGQYRTTVNVLAGATGLILLIACGNVAGLLLARGAAREAELAIRASLGAGRIRLVRQLLTESLVLSMAGSAVGVLLAWLALDAFLANIPMSLPSSSPAALNLKVLGATLALTVATGLLFGLAPAFRLSRVPISSALARGNPRHGAALSRRGGQLLVAAEIALAVVLLAGAGLMIRSFARLMGVDIGFDPEAIVTMEVLPLESATQGQYYPALLHQLRTLPGIAAVGAVDHFPLAGSSTVTSATVSGRSSGIGLRQILPGYFEALGLPLRLGRLPTDADYSAGLKGAVINEKAARDLFPDGPATGRRFTVGKNEWEVLGVVADLRHGGPLREAGPEVYLPFAPSESTVHRALAMTIVVRPIGRVPQLAEQLRRSTQEFGPRVLVERIRTGREWLGQLVVTPRRRTVLLGLLGGLGLLLALVGVFGMTAYAVTRRRQEIGVRMAFGARPGRVVATMVRDSAVPIVLGTFAGLVGAVAATRVIASFLFQTEPTDPATLAVAAITLAAAGCLAAWLPARRAARIDPVATLRTE